MYYNRTISESLSNLIEPNGKLRWLFELVKKHPDLDFLLGRNKSSQCISIYRGLSRVLTITLKKNTSEIKLDGAKAFKELSNSLYGYKHASDNLKEELENLVKAVSTNSRFDRYYNNKKEGYFQNEISRIFGINGTPPRQVCYYR